MDLRAVTEFKLCSELEDLYREIFKKKYTQDAILDEEGDKIAFSWLSSKFPAPQARAIVEAYFHLTDRFVADKMHPPKFIKSNINQINSIVRKKGFDKSVADTGKPLILNISMSCDKCFVRFNWIGISENLDARRICSACQGN